MCCIIVQRSCIIVQRRTVNCNSANAPQHTILQRACRDTSMHPMAEEYALMQPIENVMRRCNPLQPIIIQHARRHTSCRTGYLRNRHVYCNRCVPKLQRRKAFAALHIAERLLHEHCRVKQTEPGCNILLLQRACCDTIDTDPYCTTSRVR